MPAPISAVEICNLALDCFGERGNVTSIENPINSTEIIMARHYDVTRRALLEEETWNFARTEAVLPRVGDGGLYFHNKFAMPNDCIKPLSFGSAGCSIRGFEYTDEFIFINPIEPNPMMTYPTVNHLYIRYVKDVTDVSKFTALFTKYLIIQLAIDVCYKFSQDRLQQQEMIAQLRLELPKVLSVNSQNRKPRLIANSRWRNARTFADSGYGGITETSDHRYWIDIP